jgi:hypothetical protein
MDSSGRPRLKPVSSDGHAERLGGESMRRVAYTRGALLLALVLSGALAAATDPAAALIGQPAPPFRLRDVLSGKTMSLEDFRGKTVVLHFGASW